MRCFYVLVHGQLSWLAELPSTVDHAEVDRPLGFYCHRYVLAPNQDEARETAFRRVRQNLDQQTGWITDGLAGLALEAEELTVAPMHKLLEPDNKGHTFY